MNTFTHFFEFYSTDKFEDGYFYEEITGLEVTMDKNDQVLYWQGYGDYEEATQIKTLNGLYDFIKQHLDEIEEVDKPARQREYTKLEVIEELLEFISETKGFKNNGVNELDEVSLNVL